MKRLAFIGFILMTVASWAQERTTIHIEHANQMQKKRGSEAVVLKGDVYIRHENTHFYCDSAYYYEGRYAEFFHNVRMMDDSTLLETEYLTYDRNLHLACYPNHGVTTRGDKQLVSEKGYYRDDLKEFRFFRDVVAASPKYKMLTDTLYYNTRVEKMWFQGPTTIIHEENTLEGKHGYYLTERELAYLDKDPVMYNETQTMTADSLLYDRQNGFAKAMNHIEMIDTSYKVVLRGQYAELWEKIGYSFATDSAYAMYYDDPDTLFVASDTMFYHFKTQLNNEEKILGRRHVRFYKSNMQGQCDTMIYDMADSTIRMRVNPVLWTDDTQMTGDRIDIRIAHHAIDSLFQRGDAFIISKDTVEGFNQINGADMVSKFIEGGIDHVNVKGDAKVISWLREDDASLIGINKSSAKRMRILMKDKSISLIKYYETINETLYPEDELKESDRFLNGFIWREEERPKEWKDIFSRPVSSFPHNDQ